MTLTQVTTEGIKDGTIVSADLITNQDFTINSVSIGKGANSVAGNTVLGENALDATVSGANNTAIGKDTLTLLTSGGNNTAIGSEALEDNTTGSFNVPIYNDSR